MVSRATFHAFGKSVKLRNFAFFFLIHLTHIGGGNPYPDAALLQTDVADGLEEGLLARPVFLSRVEALGVPDHRMKRYTHC